MSSYSSNINKEYQVGDRVITTGRAQYEMSYEENVPIGTIGVIISIRHRYVNTPNEYKQYKVSFEGYPEGDSVKNLYITHNIKKYDL